MTLRPLALTLIATLAACQTIHAAETTELYHACKTGNIQEVQRLMEWQNHDKLFPLYGFNALHIAAQHKNLALAKFLILRCRYDINKPDTLGKTPLARAIQHEHGSMVRFLLEEGANVNEPSVDKEKLLALCTDIQKLLNYVAWRGYVETVRLLIQTLTADGSPPNLTTALKAALGKSDNFDVWHLLAEAGADINAQNDTGATMLAGASLSLRFDVVKFLTQAGANVNTPDSAGQTPLLNALNHNETYDHNFVKVVQALIHAGAHLEQADNAGITPLYAAASKGQIDIVKLLIQAGANINHRKDDDGETPLFIATKRGKSKIVEYLIQAGANVDIPDNNGATPLCIAVSTHDVAIIKALIEAGANIYTPDLDKEKLFLIAAKEGYFSIVQSLIQAGTDVDTHYQLGRTALGLASAHGHIAIVRLLIHAHANVKKATIDGSTPLYAASSRGHFAIVKLLIQAGANPHQRKVDGSTCLQRAARMGHLNIVRYLHYLGADIDAQFYPKSAFRLAAKKRRVRVARFLIRAGARTTLSDLETARQKHCSVDIMAGITDYLQAHPEELPKYRIVMQRVINANSQNLDEWLKTEKGTLSAAVCQILFPDINTSPQFVHTGKRELQRIALAKEYLSQENVATDIANLILDDCWSVPKAI